MSTAPSHDVETPAPPGERLTDPTNPGAGIDFNLYLDCVHCGLCTSACPTYVELGDENDSPRGRIYLMRAVAEERLPLTDKVRGHLELCLDCRACETACPSGVQYGRLIEPFRLAMEAHEEPDWFKRWILFRLLPSRSRLRAALVPARIAQALRLDRVASALGLFKLLPGKLRRLVEMLPPRVPDDGPLPPVLPAIGTQRAKVALFLGCAADAMLRHTHWATARVLQQNGCEVHVPDGQTCCGAIHFHGGDGETARELADQNTAAFSAGDYDAIIVNVAGCGAMMKEYEHHWSDNAPGRDAFAAKVRDVNEFLDELGFIPPTGEVRTIATYHDACHLGHAQKVTAAPRKLLAHVPGLELRPLAETELCCGAAGTYNLLQPEMAGRLARRKMANIDKTGARVVIAANAGCIFQIAAEARQRGNALRVMHPMDILDLAYREESTVL